jgi:Carbohydrate esterase, sialic acid-specific acetylesterase
MISMRVLLLILCFLNFIAGSSQPAERTVNFPRQTDIAKEPRNKKKVWVFILAGQSNMAGRGWVQPEDTLAEKRLLTIDKDGQLILAKEPLHFYEPNLAGLDCGYSFGTTLLKNVPSDISVLLIPTAVGGSSISQWLGDSVHRSVKLFSNFLKKLEIGKQYGIIKGILWHQGESDANEKDIPLYKERLSELIGWFRATAGSSSLPVLLGELGSYSNDKEHWKLINNAINEYSLGDKYTSVISTADLEHKGDNIHFDSNGQRLMGKRFAEAYLKKFK